MDTDTDQISDTTPSEVVDTPASDAPASESSPEVTEGGDTTQTTEVDEHGNAHQQMAPAYVPDYKLKVYDKETELDDPFLKALIKDADSEKKVKEIAQKFLGFDTVKERHEKTKTDYASYQSQTQPIVQYYNTASKMLQNNDLGSFFNLLRIPDEVVFRYAVARAEEAQLPAAQREQINQQRQVAQERNYLQEQNQSLQSSAQQQLSEFRNQELNWVAARPEVAPVVQAFDAKNGQGAFRNLVRDKALAHFTATGGKEDLTAEQAVGEVIKLIGSFVNNGAQPTPGSSPTQPQLIPQNGTPPIIPNVPSRSTSPVRKQVRSISDLKKRNEELYGNRSS